jgi:hypothetical protein
VDLVHDAVAVGPAPKGSTSTSVADAVGDELAHHQCDIAAALGVQAVGGGMPFDHPPQGAEVGCFELHGRRRALGLRQGIGERGRQVGGGVEALDRRTGTAEAHDGVGSVHALQVCGVEGIGVVGAEDPRGFVGEDAVEERLVKVALDGLGLGAPGPQRLADASHGAAGMTFDEIVPDRDDATRVPPDVGDVDVRDLTMVVAHDLSQAVDDLWSLQDQHRLLMSEAVGGEGRQLPDEVVDASVLQSFMPKRRGGPQHKPRIPVGIEVSYQGTKTTLRGGHAGSMEAPPSSPASWVTGVDASRPVDTSSRTAGTGSASPNRVSSP